MAYVALTYIYSCGPEPQQILLALQRLVLTTNVNAAAAIVAIASDCCRRCSWRSWQPALLSSSPSTSGDAIALFGAAGIV